MSIELDFVWILSAFVQYQRSNNSLKLVICSLWADERRKACELKTMKETVTIVDCNFQSLSFLKIEILLNLQRNLHLVSVPFFWYFYCVTIFWLWQLTLIYNKNIHQPLKLNQLLSLSLLKYSYKTTTTFK